MNLATAVILSYNRQDALRRQLLYYANKPVHLIFADGSDDDWGTGESGSIGAMTWEYFRISGFDSYVERTVTAVYKVKTEFMFFLDDEDCTFWTGVERAVDFLTKNSDHSCAGGRADTIECLHGRLGIRGFNRFSTSFELLQPIGIERFEKMCAANRTANLFYQVLRTASARAYVGALDLKFKIFDSYVGYLEIAFCGFLAFCGKWEMGTYPFSIKYFAAAQHNRSRYRDHISSKAATELSVLIDKAVNLHNRDYGKIDAGIDQFLTAKIILCNYGQTGVHVQLRHDGAFVGIGMRKNLRQRFSNFARRMVLPLIMNTLWRYIPRIFELLFPEPNELSSMKSFVRAYDAEISDLSDDVSHVEEIWSKFPIGLNAEQLMEELRLRANI